MLRLCAAGTLYGVFFFRIIILKKSILHKEVLHNNMLFVD